MLHSLGCAVNLSSRIITLSEVTRRKKEELKEQL
jgi:hypothetical protein